MTDTIHVLHCGLCRKPFDMTLDPDHTLDPDRAGFVCEACAEEEIKLEKINDLMFTAHCAEQEAQEQNQARMREYLKVLIHECLDERESDRRTAKS